MKAEERKKLSPYIVISLTVVVFLLSLIPMYNYIWINRWFLLALLIVFFIGSLLIKVNTSINAEYPPFGYWLVFSIAVGFYYSIWQQPEMLGAILGNYFSMGPFSIKNESGFYYALASWVGISLMGYSLPFLKNADDNTSSSADDNENTKEIPFKKNILSFAFAMFGYLLYLNITVTMVSIYFGRF